LTQTAILILLCILPQATQPAREPPDFYVESWKKGSTKIKEEKLVLRQSCDGSSATVEAGIASLSGEVRYLLKMTPAKPCEANATLGWVVWLFETDRAEFELNLLKPTNDPHQDYFSAKDIPAWFLVEPHGVELRESMVPLHQRRIIKVEDFYCVLSLLDVSYSDTEPRLMRDLTIEVELWSKFVVRRVKAGDSQWVRLPPGN
jgi:hypothetical protein